MPKTTMDKDRMFGRMLGMIVVSMLIPAVLLIAALIYVAFYSSGYTLFQKVVIVIIALIIIAVAEGLLWMVWGWKKGFAYWKMYDPESFERYRSMKGWK